MAGGRGKMLRDMAEAARAERGLHDDAAAPAAPSFPERTSALQELHLWALLGYTAVTASVALACYVCARAAARARQADD